MGSYLNEGCELYRMGVNSEIHVDKSMLIRETNARICTNERYICLSRPRRFGKSMAAHMLMAYYMRGADSLELFKDKKIYSDPSFEKHFGKYNVIHLRMTDFVAGGIDAMVTTVLRMLKVDVRKEAAKLAVTEEFAGRPPFQLFDEDNIFQVLQDFYEYSGAPYVFVIDEWDCLMRETAEDEAEQRKYLDFLKILLKDRAYVALAYMTGILPVKKYGAQSALNMFWEYSMEDALGFAEFTGFTQDETAALCERYGIDFNEARVWYDGYRVNGIPIFNPRSIVQLCLSRRFANYWTRTETYESLKTPLMLGLDGLHEKVERLIAGDRVEVNTLLFQNDMTHIHSADDVLTLLLHLGYVTYDRETKTCRIPNNEVAVEFENSIEGEASWTPVLRALKDSDACLKAILAGDAATVAALVERCHQENTSVIKYNDENSLACVVSLALYAARRQYVAFRELPSGKGYADIAFLPRPGQNVPAIVVELKAEGAASIALEQIRRREYPEALKGFSGEMVLVGIDYKTDPANPDYKHHRCGIERLKG